MPQFRAPQPNQYPPQQRQGQPPPQPQWQEHPSQSLHPNTGYQQSGPQWPTQQSGMYPPQLPMQSVGYPPPQPPKKSRRGLWIVISVLAAVMLLAGVGIAAIIASAGQAGPSSVNTTHTSNATSVPTSAATSSGTTTIATSSISTSGGNWTTTHTFTGSGTKKTAIFTVGNDWKIIYSCSGMARIAENGYLGVYVYGSNGSVAGPAAINASCKFSAALTKGETEEHQGGPVYLDITGTSDWTVSIQELK